MTPEKRRCLFCGSDLNHPEEIQRGACNFCFGLEVAWDDYHAAMSEDHLEEC